MEWYSKSGDATKYLALRIGDYPDYNDDFYLAASKWVRDVMSFVKIADLDEFGIDAV